MTIDLIQERSRLSLQARLDSEKTQSERNRLGQFATPTTLAQEVLRFGLGLLGEDIPIRFLDPAVGTGAFFSALVHTVPMNRIETAKGYEVDPSYVESTRDLWRGTPLDVVLADFTRTEAPSEEAKRFNLLICNPPYVRHHHVLNGEKIRLQNATEAACGVHIAGLAGLYCYFLGLSHPWMQRSAIAGWLVPSEFMDVNYGGPIKQYLLDKVTLLRIHRFNPDEVQFDDALVSSSVVWFRNDPPPADHCAEFTFGGSLLSPEQSRIVPSTELLKESKWTRFPTSGIRDRTSRCHLSDLFTIKRGVATGCNKFFILNKEQIAAHDLPCEVFRPILPGPRYILTNEIEADTHGLPLIDRQLFLLDSRLPETQVREKYPKLWQYLERGVGNISSRYLCKSRKIWYSQEERAPAPILCTYLGRSDAKGGHPFRFILNHSQAIAPNVYLMLYPKPVLARAIDRDKSTLRRIWEILNGLCPDSLLEEGRVYGGGLHKLEPHELGNVNASAILENIAELRSVNTHAQLQLQLT